MSTKVNPKAEEVAKEQAAAIKAAGPNQRPQMSEKALAEAEENMEKSMMSLISDGRFFSSLLLNMRREFTNRIATLGVNVTDEVNLFINPYFFNALSLDEQVEVLKHECYHVINNHFARFRDLEPQIFETTGERSLADVYAKQQNASILNQAADYAINEYLPKLPQNFKMFNPDGTAQMNPEKLPNGQPNPNFGKPLEGNCLWVKDLRKKVPNTQHQQQLEYYYEILKKKQEEDKKNGKGQGQGGQGEGEMTLDDHSIWHEGDQTQDQITDKVKQVVNKAAEQCDDREMGSLGADIRQAIENLNHVPRDWRQDVQRFVARTAEIVIESTRKKRNRRYGIVYPGQLIFPKLHLAIGIDTSGSVMDEELQQFFSEMSRLHKMEIVLTVIECDTKVHKVYKFNPKKPFEVSGRGGTSFKPVFDKCNELEVDGLIYFTDGECCDEGVKKPKYQVLWAVTGDKKRLDYVPYKWGHRTHIQVRKKVKV